MIFTETGNKYIIEFEDDDTIKQKRIAISMFNLLKALLVEKWKIINKIYFIN